MSLRSPQVGIFIHRIIHFILKLIVYWYSYRSHFKKLNPEFSSIKVPQSKKNEKVFSYNDSVYSDLRAGLKNIKNQNDSFAAESIVVPLKKQVNCVFSALSYDSSIIDIFSVETRRRSPIT